MGVVAAIQLYDVILFVHVGAVVVAFGATFAYPFLQAVVERVSPRSVPAMFRAMHTASRFLVTPGLFVVLAAGIYLTADRWNFGYLLVTTGLAIIAVLAVLGVAFFDRQEARLIELSERDVAPPEPARSSSARSTGRCRGASPAWRCWPASSSWPPSSS
jgi:hypothetical protein